MIRQIGEDDLGGLYKIFSENITNPWSMRSLLELYDNENNIFLGYFKRGSLLGYVIFSIVFEDCEIFSIATDKAYRRTGIGKALTTEVVSRAKKAGATRLLLEVRSKNTAAKKFYASLGFKPVGTRFDYYDMPLDDADVMRLDI